MPPIDPDEEELAAVRGGQEGDELLRRIGGAARAVWEDTRELLPVPDGLWGRIEAGLTVDPAPVIPLARNSGRRRRWLLGAVAAAAVLALVAALSIFASGPDAEELVAEVSLDALAPGESASGTARLVRRQGRLELDVATTGLPAAEGGYYELWMIDRDVTRLLSLGPLLGLRFPLPADLDPAAFPLVDISVESLDGDPGHSGDSVLRGVLEV